MFSGSQSLIHLLRLIVMGCSLALSAAGGILFSTNLVLALLSLATAGDWVFCFGCNRPIWQLPARCNCRALPLVRPILNAVMEYALDAVVRMNFRGAHH